MKIFINPGHGPASKGYFDPGAVGPSGVRECDVAWRVGYTCTKALEDAGQAVFLVQHGELMQLTEMANKSGADVFISIHCNSFHHPEAHGTETYTFTADSKARPLAAAVQESVLSILHTTDRGLKTANFWVLKHTDMPAMLTELAFISNPEEEQLLNDPDIQDRLGLAIAGAIIDVYHLSKPEKPASGPCCKLPNGDSVEGRIIDDRLWLPARALAEGLGYEIEWNKCGAIIKEVKPC